MLERRGVVQVGLKTYGGDTPGGAIKNSWGKGSQHHQEVHMYFLQLPRVGGKKVAQSRVH